MRECSTKNAALANSDFTVGAEKNKPITAL